MKLKIFVILSAFGVVLTNMVNAYDLAGKLFEVQIPGRSTIDLYFLDTEVVLAIESDYIWMNSYSATGLAPTSIITIGDDDIPSSIELKSANQAQLTRYDNGDVSIVDLTYSVTNFDPSGIFESLFNRSIEEDFSSGVILTASQLNTENFPNTNFLHDEGYVAGSSDFEASITDGALSIRKVRQEPGDDASWSYDVEINSLNKLDNNFQISTNIDLDNAAIGGFGIEPYSILDYWDCYGLDLEVAKFGGENYSIILNQWIDDHHQVMHPEGRFDFYLGTDVSAAGTIRLRVDNDANESTFYIRYMGGEEDPSNSSLWRTACTFNYSTGVWAFNDYKSGNLKDQQGASITFEYGSNGTFNSLSYPQITSPNALYEAITVELTGFFTVSDNEENWKNSEVRFLDFNSSFYPDSDGDDVDEIAPVFASSETATAIAENLGANQFVYTALATDASGVTYSLKEGEDSSSFSIDGTTGEVTLKEDPDYEIRSSYAFTVIATDSSGNRSEKAVSLSITDVDEIAPIFTSSEETSAIAENSGSDQVIYTAEATDNSYSVTYTLEASGDHELLTINSENGEVSLSEGYLIKNSYTFSIRAVDMLGNIRESTYGIARSPWPYGPGDVIYTAEAPGKAQVTYSLKEGEDSSSFSIDSTSGDITLIESPDYESKSSYAFTVIATDPSGNTSEKTVTLAINDVEETEEVSEAASSWVPEGWVYYAWPYAYSFTEARWYFFDEPVTQWRVNLTSVAWGKLDVASGWNYYAWPCSYSFDEGAWHWYDNDTQWVVDLLNNVWTTFGGYED